jgi:hypothetical protein
MPYLIRDPESHALVLGPCLWSDTVLVAAAVVVVEDSAAAAAVAVVVAAAVCCAAFSISLPRVIFVRELRRS